MWNALCDGHPAAIVVTEVGGAEERGRRQTETLKTGVQAFKIDTRCGTALSLAT